MHNRKSSLLSGKTKNSSLASVASMRSLFSLESSPSYPSKSTFQDSSQVIQELQEKLLEKDKTISSYKKRIEELDDHESPKSQPDYLLKLLKKGDNKLDKLKDRIETITKENEALLNKQKDLVSLIAKYKKENFELRQALSITKNNDSFADFNSKLIEIENLQQDLIKENFDLKNELTKASSRSDEMIDLKFSVLGSEIYKAKIELANILKVCRICKSGHELDLGLLLIHHEENENIFESNYKQCISLIVCMRKDIEEIKDIIADMKAEHYGDHCVTQ